MQATDTKKACYRCKQCNAVQSRINRLSDKGFVEGYKKLDATTRAKFMQDLCMYTQSGIVTRLEKDLQMAEYARVRPVCVSGPVCP